MIVWDSEAEQELQDIYNYIFLDSPQNADMVVSELLSLIQDIPNMPYKYPKDPFSDDDAIRFIAKWNYKIIYEIDDSLIRIASVFSTRKSPEKQYKKH